MERRDGGASMAGAEEGAQQLSSIEIAKKCSVCDDLYCENSLQLRCMKKYYNSMRGWTMGSNYYVKTFIGNSNSAWHGNKGDFYWTYHK